MINGPRNIPPNELFGLPLHSAGPYAATYAFKDKVFPYVMIRWGVNSKIDIFAHCNNYYHFHLTEFHTIPDAIAAMETVIKASLFDPKDLAGKNHSIFKKLRLMYLRKKNFGMV